MDPFTAIGIAIGGLIAGGHAASHSSEEEDSEITCPNCGRPGDHLVQKDLYGDGSCMDSWYRCDPR